LWVELFLSAFSQTYFSMKTIYAILTTVFLIQMLINQLRNNQWERKVYVRSLYWYNQTRINRPYKLTKRKVWNSPQSWIPFLCIS
jgi:hypothetical protein